MKNEKIFKVNFSSIGILPFEKSVVYLSPVMDSNLYGIHKRFYKFFENESLDYVDYYLPEKWIPHCTVASRLNIKEVINSVITMKYEFKVIKALVKYVGVIQGDPVKEIACIKL